MSEFYSGLARPVYERATAVAVKRTKASIGNLNADCTIMILSFLEQKELARTAAASKEFNMLSKHPSLWTRIKIDNADYLDLFGLARLISLTTRAQPLRALSLSAADCSGCYCREDNTCHSCSLVPPCTSTEVCDNCLTIEPLKDKFGRMSSFYAHAIPYLSSCPVNTILKHSRNLTCLDILNDLDVNIVVAAAANYCPHLTELKFSYAHGLDFGAAFRSSHPLLRPQVAEALVRSCPGIKVIHFCHYTIDEECARRLLNLTHIVHVDLSDNEGLTAAFLVGVPAHWLELRSLVIRDCTELDSDFVNVFANALAQCPGGTPLHCTKLEYVDFSCQWAFSGDSFIGDDELREELMRRRGSKLRWREDHCELFDFGVDPESGIDGIESMDYVEGSYGDYNGEDIVLPDVELEEALNNSNHSLVSAQSAH